MASLKYLIKNKRGQKKKRSRAPALNKCPQRRGICMRIYIVPPKKPHSAKRKVARIGFSVKKKIICYIPGEGHNLRNYSAVLIRGGRVRDLPGIKYKLIHGVLDFQGLAKRVKSRSKYGTKRWVIRRIPRSRIRKIF
jgi:small subunit ribosomal protein S12